MSITLGDQIEEIVGTIDEIKRKREEKFRKLYIEIYRRAEESEEWAESMVERARDRQREIEEAWRRRFGCECGLHGITCNHKKQSE